MKGYFKVLEFEKFQYLIMKFFIIGKKMDKIHQGFPIAEGRCTNLDGASLGGFRGSPLMYLGIVALFLIVACVKEPIGWYPDVGVIEVKSDTLVVTFHVPDPNSNGWHPGEGGEASQELTITLKEKAKKDVAISKLNLEFYDENGSEIATHLEHYVPAIEIDGGKEYSYSVVVKVSEGIADELDDETGAENDFLGKGIIKFSVEGYDLQRGEEINCIPSYTPIQVEK